MKSIETVRPGDSFEKWHNVTCRQFSLTDCKTRVGAGFKARVTVRPFGALALNGIWSSTHTGDALRVSRRPKDIRADQRDFFMVWLMLDGTAELHQEGRHARLQSGDIVLQDQARPFDLEFGQIAHAAMVMVPRPLLTSRLPDAALAAARRIAAGSALAPVAGSLVRQLFALDEAVDDRTTKRLGAAALDIIAVALEREIGTSVRDQQEGRLEDAKAYMRAQMHDCDLDLESVVRATSLARRTLFRLFAQDATTPMQWLWEQRLLESYRLLGQGRPPRVTDVALACGFKDVSHFSKAFRARFGHTPSSPALLGSLKSAKSARLG
ncbi:AraC family transcriptional regulator [Cereibacter sp. SYSU M97828]|nr:AraC family transcriptional regulator [Cereibacter flavus]